MDWVFPPKWHDFLKKKLLFIFIICICLASQFKSQYTVWTECSPQNDMILWKNNWKKLLFIFIIVICLTS